jgi:hypothetical protein
MVQTNQFSIFTCGKQRNTYLFKNPGKKVVINVHLIGKLFCGFGIYK